MSFELAFQHTVGLEGEFTDDPHDKGNWTGGQVGVGILKGTKYGISAAQYAALDIQDLTLPEAMQIYLRDYWNPLRLDEIINGWIQMEIFDTAVNMGRRLAVQICQRSLDYLGSIMAVDGIMGPITLEALNFWCGKDRRALHVCLNGFQFVRYVELRYADPANLLRFARGWTRRIGEYYV